MNELLAMFIIWELITHNPHMENRQKWLTDKIAGEWRDKDHIIDTVLMECLIHYVEDELGGIIPDEEYWKLVIDNGEVAREYADAKNKIYSDIRKAYDYVKIERPKLEKQIENMDACQSCFSLMDELEKRDDEIMEIIFKNRHYMWT